MAMNKKTTVLSSVLCTFLALGGFVLAGEHSPAGTESEVELVALDAMDVAPEPAATPEAIAAPSEITTRLRIPLLAHDWWSTTAYVDLDPAAGAWHDYECGPVTYDGHTGNDFALRDFVEQDEGRFVIAGAAGTVLSTDDGYFDKETGGIAGTPVNFVIVEHDDGSQTYYLHLKKWSVQVHPGQEVREGQPLGMVGSSGQSTGPHLHLAIWKDGVNHEPHEGLCRLGDSLWQDQPPYVFDNSVELVDAGTTTVNPAGLYLSRPPDVHHVEQLPGGTVHYFWFSLNYCHVGDVARMIYRDPLGAVYKDVNTTCTQWYSRVAGKWTTTLPALGSLGTWTVELRLNEVTVAEETFLYDAVPAADPVGVGRTVPVLHGTAGGELVGTDADSDVKEFRIVTQPPRGRVTLHGPRKKYFAYTPNSGFTGTDTFRFEVEDGQGDTGAPATMVLDVEPVVANTTWFEGNDDYVYVPDNGSLNLTNALTLEAWVRRAQGSAGWSLLIDRRVGSNSEGFSLAIQPESTLRFGLGDGSTATFAYGTTPIPLNRWVHVAATWDGAMMRVFVDGVEDGTPVAFSGPISYPGTYPTLLGRAPGEGASFRGDVDEMRIWSVARGVTDLRAGATCAFPGGPPPASLRGWWRFRGNANDESAQGNHGTLIGDAYLRNTDGALPLCPADDQDGDGWNDAVDVCPFAADAGQADADGDGMGDACDLCPDVSVASLADSDHDGVGDACDLCPFLADTDQLDTDFDGSGDVCDPLPGDGAVALPSAAIDLLLAHDRAAGETTVSWAAEPYTAEYRVIRGTLEEIRDRFYGACVSSADPDTSDTTFVDDETPAPNGLFGYLVVGVAPTGDAGLAGVDSGGRQRDLRAKDCL
jgi:murein DD-endopeptidase MepM/ murein hydrolase activator NlpD